MELPRGVAREARGFVAVEPDSEAAFGIVIRPGAGGPGGAESGAAGRPVVPLRRAFALGRLAD